jgi:IPT/TIG domain
VSLDVDAIGPRRVREGTSPPVIVEPGDPYPYLYALIPDSDSLVMSVGTVGFFPEAGGDRPPPEPPVVSSVAPTSIVATEVTPMTVTGTGFRDGDAVYQDEGMMPTTFVSDTELTFTAQADAEGTVDISVRGVGGASNSISVPVTAAAGP